ncbi:L,D-transpeptidase family protein [uncultured Cardiobacterium sp.]|uniref:L,D-transpeptidase family protein n=1 Tax=uncultured Cardiobacterium sp. TaxID=417619 RepID=UPI00262AD811|nr:L,D-transpeptidase family protein [uncultured Cardiobacterium sp.]
MNVFSRYRVASIIGLLALHGPAFAQEPIEEAVFDDAPPSIADNLPPDPSVATSELSAMATEDAQPQEAMTQPHQAIIGEEMRPFNSRRIELIEALALNPTEVLYNGRTYPLKNPQRLRLFYENEQYPTVWTQENSLLERVDALKRLIADAPQDALPPARYHSALIDGLQAGAQYDDIVPLELLLTDAYLTLAGDLANGLVSPRKTHPEWNAEGVSDEALGDMLAQGVVSGDIETAVRTINDGNPRYQALKQRYNAVVGDAILTPASSGEPLPKVTLRPGMNHEAVAILRDKLNVPAEGGDPFYYDDLLADAVLTYQQNNGLKADGIVSGKTRNMLNGGNKSGGARNVGADSLMINMERQRWLPQDMGETYVLVNIPSYYVKMYHDNRPIYETKAIMGRRDRQTPAFVNHLRHVVMSPTWTVPPTILKKDKINKLRSNPGAFDGNFDAVVGGRVLRPSEVNWNSPSALHYTLRQKPGARNALGRVKFLFPNKHAIYLHDTPSKGLFNRSDRALSSGCVRLQKPEEFANVLLNNNGWSSERIKKAMNQSKEQWVNTPETPIYLVYWTTWTEPDGRLQTAGDVYGKDNILLQQYKKALN